MTYRIFLAMLLGLICGPLSAKQSAAPDTRDKTPLFEITPFAGLRLGGDFKVDDPSRKVNLDDSAAFALALDLRIDDISQYELFYGRQSAHVESDRALGRLGVDVEYLHVGGVIEMEDARRAIPYMMGGVGATRFSPSPGDVGDKTRFSLSLGGGVKVPVTPRFAVRLEGRGYVTFVDTDTSFFCRSDESGALCRIHGSGSTFLQFELMAGATFAF